MSQLVLDEDGEVVGELTHVLCPRCRAEIVYNGNYFCRLWTYPFTGEAGTCDWTLGSTDDDLLDAGDVVTDEDRAVWRALCRTYPPLVEYRRRQRRREGQPRTPRR